MAVTAFWYGPTLRKQLTGSGGFNWASDTIIVSLHLAAYTPNQDTHEFFSSATNEHGATGGYVRKTLANKTTSTWDATNNRAFLDADDVVWSTSTMTARYAVIWKDTGSAATSPLLGYVDFGQDESSLAAAFTITWSADGILRVTAA